MLSAPALRDITSMTVRRTSAWRCAVRPGPVGQPCSVITRGKVAEPGGSQVVAAVGVQQANITLAQQNLRLAEAALWPSVNFVTSYTGATAFGRENPDLLFMMLNVEVPIFDWGHGRDQKQEEEFKLKAAQAELGQVHLDLREAILSELSNIHTTESAIATLESDYLSAKNNVDLIQEQHDQGISTQLALVDAQEALSKAKDQVLLARLVQRLEYVQLQKLSGGIWVWNK